MEGHTLVLAAICKQQILFVIQRKALTSARSAEENAITGIITLVAGIVADILGRFGFGSSCFFRIIIPENLIEHYIGNTALVCVKANLPHANKRIFFLFFTDCAQHGSLGVITIICGKEFRIEHLVIFQEPNSLNITFSYLAQNLVQLLIIINSCQGTVFFDCISTGNKMVS